MHLRILGLMALLLAMQSPTALANAFDCESLQTGSQPLGQTAQPALAYLQAFADPLYGTTTTRVTQPNGTPYPAYNGQHGSFPAGNWPSPSAGACRTQYGSHQAWNADGSILFLRVCPIFLDGDTYEVMHRTLPSGDTSVENWTATEPTKMFIARNINGHGTILKWDALTFSESVVVTATGYNNLSMPVTFSPSNDDKWLGVVASRNSDGAKVCMLLDLVNGEVDLVRHFSDFGFTQTESKARECGVSATGQFLVMDGWRNGYTSNQAIFFFNDEADRPCVDGICATASKGDIVAEVPDNGGVECTAGHGDFGVTKDGRDVLVGVCKGNGPTGGTTVSFDPASASLSSIGPSLPHTSCRNTERVGWCFGGGYGSANSEILAISLDGDRVEHVANTYTDNWANKYWAQPQPVVAPDGTKVVFVTDWNGAFSEHHTFVVDFENACSVPASLDPPILF